MTTYRQTGTTNTVDENGNPVNYSGNLDSLQAITPGSLQPATPLQTVAATPDTTNYAGITGSVTDSIASDYNGLNTQFNTKQDEQNATGQDILSQMQALTGKEADTQAAEDASGVNQANTDVTNYASQLADLNGQAKSLNREAQGIPLVTQENNRNTGATDRGVAPQDAGALRINALKALSIGQQADIASAALTGSQLRLQAAKDKAQKIIDLKYKPLEDQLAIKEKQYELNKDVLSAIDSKRTEALGITLKKEADDIAQKKADAKEASDLAFTLQQNGAPAAIVQAALKAGSKVDVQKIPGVSQYLTSPSEKLDIALKQQQLIKAKSDNNAKPGGKIVKINGRDYIQNPDGTFSNPQVPGAANASTGSDPLSQLTNTINSSGVKDNTKLQDVLGVLSAASQFATSNPDGKFAGLGPLGQHEGSLLVTGKGTSNRSAIEAINLKVQQWASGASLTTEQTKQVKKITPQVGDTDRTVKQKTNALAKFMQNQAQGLLASQGIQYNPSDYDYFGQNQSSTASLGNYLDSVDGALQDTSNPYTDAGYDTK